MAFAYTPESYGGQCKGQPVSAGIFVHKELRWDVDMARPAFTLPVFPRGAASRRCFGFDVDSLETSSYLTVCMSLL